VRKILRHVDYVDIASCSGERCERGVRLSRANGCYSIGAGLPSAAVAAPAEIVADDAVASGARAGSANKIRSSMAVLRVTYVSPRKPQLISSPRPHGFNTAVVPGNVFRIRGWETRHCFALAREISQSSRCNAIGGREGLGVERRRGEVMSPLPRDRAVSLRCGT
jgi:hypothetical protein